MFALSSKAPVFFLLLRAHAVTLGKLVAMGALSVSIVSMVIKDTPAGLVHREKPLIGSDFNVAINLYGTIKFRQAF